MSDKNFVKSYLEDLSSLLKPNDDLVNNFSQKKVMAPA